METIAEKETLFLYPHLQQPIHPGGENHNKNYFFTSLVRRVKKYCKWLPPEERWGQPFAATALMMAVVGVTGLRPEKGGR